MKIILRKSQEISLIPLWHNGVHTGHIFCSEIDGRVRKMTASHLTFTLVPPVALGRTNLLTMSRTRPSSFLMLIGMEDVKFYEKFLTIPVYFFGSLTSPKRPKFQWLLEALPCSSNFGVAYSTILPRIHGSGLTKKNVSIMKKGSRNICFSSTST